MINFVEKDFTDKSLAEDSKGLFKEIIFHILKLKYRFNNDQDSKKRHS